MNANTVVSKLDRVKATGSGRWIACCPAHDDKSPSLAVRELDDGRVLLHCFAGCEAESILAAIGLQMADLFPAESQQATHGRERRPFNPFDVLRCVAFEAVVTSVAAGNLARGWKLSGEDYARLFVAAGRLQRAAEIATDA